MTGQDTRRYNMLMRVRSFAATYRQLFPDTSSAHDAFAEVAAAIDQLEALDVAERSATDGARADRQVAARRLFQKFLRRAGATGRVLGKTIPQLQVRIPLPLPKDERQLLTLARQFAAGVADYGPEFAARGMPLEVLEAGIAALEGALAHRGNSREGRVKARAEREAVFGRAMHAVEKLDVTVANGIEDPVALALWKYDRRVKARRRPAAAVTQSILAAPPPAVNESTALTRSTGTRRARAALRWWRRRELTRKIGCW